jgi:putative transposase
LFVEEVRSNNNVVYRCTYDVVWCPKYRRKVIAGPVDDRLKQIIGEVCDPQFGIHRLVKQIKGRSSRLLRQEFPSLRRRLPTLWTNSYFVATVGGATLEAVKRYVENQRNV